MAQTVAVNVSPSLVLQNNQDRAVNGSVDAGK